MRQPDIATFVDDFQEFNNSAGKLKKNEHGNGLSW